MPLLSICIVAYNLERYIGRCIESALCQGFSDYEIVLVDNGSEDDTTLICTDYAAKYPDKIRFFALPQPNVPVRGHIEAVHHAKGAYIHLVDGDDQVAEHYLDSIVPILQQRAPELLMGDFRCVIEEGATHYQDVPIDPAQINDVPTEQAIEYLFALPYLNRYTWRFIVSRRLVDLADFDSQTKHLIGVDGLKSTIWMLNAKSIYFYGGAFYYYTMRKGSTVTSTNNSFIMDMLKLILTTGVSLSLLHDTTLPIARCFALERSQAEWYLRLFLSGSDFLSETEFDDLAVYFAQYRGQLAILKQFDSPLLNEFYDTIMQEDISHALQDYVALCEKRVVEMLSDSRKPVVIFPCGRYAAHTQRLLQRVGIHSAAFLDNDEKKNNRQVDGLPCFSPQQFIRQHGCEKDSYLIATIYDKLKPVFYEQLLQYGVSGSDIFIRE